MTIAEARAITWNTPLWVLFQDGEIMSVRLNGSVKTWVRDQNRVEVPLKFGAHARGQFRSVSQSDGTMSDLIVLLDASGNRTDNETYAVTQEIY